MLVEKEPTNDSLHAPMPNKPPAPRRPPIPRHQHPQRQDPQEPHRAQHTMRDNLLLVRRQRAVAHAGRGGGEGFGEVEGEGAGVEVLVEGRGGVRGTRDGGREGPDDVL